MRLTLNETGCLIQLETGETLAEFIPWMKKAVEQWENDIAFLDDDPASEDDEND